MLFIYNIFVPGDSDPENLSKNDLIDLQSSAKTQLANDNFVRGSFKFLVVSN